VIKKEKEFLKGSDLNELRIVDYDWVIKNGWKGRNNPNILFKNLYFLFKVKKDQFIKYKVGRTIIAY